MNRTLAITSGKGGVGKTNIGLNLSLHLSRKGYRTCLFDADFGLANINILLGLQPEYDLRDVILKGMKLNDIIIPTFNGVHVLPGSSGLEEMANLQDSQVETLVRSLSEMEGYDFTVFDTAAGISKNVITLCLSSPEVIIVITPEPTSLTDSFTLLKVLLLNGFKGEVKIIVNQCNSNNTANLVYKKFHSAVKKFLGMNIKALGLIYQDKNVVEAVKQQRPFLLEYPTSKASRCICAIGDRIINNTPVDTLESKGMAGFWKRCLRLMNSPLQIPGANKEDKKRDDTKKYNQEHKEKNADQKKPEHEQAYEETPVKKETVKKETVSSRHESYIPSLETLNQNLKALGMEIRELKDAVKEMGGGLYSRTGEKEESDPKGINHKPIILDIEAFLKKKGLTKNGDTV